VNKLLKFSWYFHCSLQAATPCWNFIVHKRAVLATEVMVATGLSCD
jgi:hypothetical protein